MAMVWSGGKQVVVVGDAGGETMGGNVSTLLTLTYWNQCNIGNFTKIRKQSI